jgi:hypothetical protein
MDVKLGLPNPFTSKRTAWGWDTTLGAAGLVGGEAKASLYGGAGASYSFPIGKTHVTAKTMSAIRHAFATVKILADLISLSPLGLLRDIVAAFTGDVASDAEAALAGAVTTHVVKPPAGAAAG